MKISFIVINKVAVTGVKNAKQQLKVNNGRLQPVTIININPTQKHAHSEQSIGFSE